MIHAVEKVCTYLPSSLSGQCKDLVETYGQAIIELLVQQADPKTVCTVLALCNNARRAYVGKLTTVSNLYLKTCFRCICCRINQSVIQHKFHLYV